MTGQELIAPFSLNTLCERWDLSPSSVRKLEHKGFLVRIHKMPGVFYTAKSVIALEQCGDMESWNMMSPMERLRLVREKNLWKERAEKAEKTLDAIIKSIETIRKGESL